MTKTSWSLVAVLASFAAAPALADDESASESKPVDAIVVEVRNLKASDGQIGCSIFSKEDGFPMEAKKADQSFFVKPKAKKATCAFENLKPGIYAVSVIHDLDEDGELETSMVGKPKEPWGVSNDAPAQRFGPPKFSAAKFRYEGGEKKLKVKLQE